MGATTNATVKSRAGPKGQNSLTIAEHGNKSARSRIMGMKEMVLLVGAVQPDLRAQIWVVDGIGDEGGGVVGEGGPAGHVRPDPGVDKARGTRDEGDGVVGKDGPAGRSKWP